MPPPSRNHRVPTVGDTPATTPASSLEDRQRPLARSVTDARAALPAGRPGDSIAGLPVAAAAHPLGRPIHTPPDRGVRRPLESPSTPRRSSRGSPASTTWSAPLAARRCGTTLRPNHSGPHSKSSSTTDTYGRPDSRQARSRRLDRTSLQPTQTPLDHRYHQPGRLRRQTHSDRTSRLTLCPTHGVKPRTPCA
jgi:hypothetical protein